MISTVYVQRIQFKDMLKKAGEAALKLCRSLNAFWNNMKIYAIRGSDIINLNK
jgi:hypothetical protein